MMEINYVTHCCCARSLFKSSMILFYCSGLDSTSSSRPNDEADVGDPQDNSFNDSPKRLSDTCQDDSASASESESDVDVQNIVASTSEITSSNASSYCAADVHQTDLSARRTSAVIRFAKGVEEWMPTKRCSSQIIE
jgi:hypothetical protein